MTKKTDKVNSFLNTLWGKITGAIIFSIVVCLVGWKDEVIAQFSEGQALLEQKQYNDKFDSRLYQQFNNLVFMDSLKRTKLYKAMSAQEREKLVKEIQHDDATKLKMSAYISDGTGMAKKAMMDTMIVMVTKHNKDVNNKKKFVTNSECIFNSKKYGRGQHAMMRQ